MSVVQAHEIYHRRSRKGDGLVEGGDQRSFSLDKIFKGEGFIPKIQIVRSLKVCNICSKYFGQYGLRVASHGWRCIFVAYNNFFNTIQKLWSPEYVSCKQFGVAGKLKAKKRTLTNIVYLVNFIINFTKGSTKVKQYNMHSPKYMTKLMVYSNMHMIIRLTKIEYCHETKITQMTIAILFSTIMANKEPHTLE